MGVNFTKAVFSDDVVCAVGVFCCVMYMLFFYF